MLANVAKEEARHYTFYRSVFKAVLERDPNQGLVAALEDHAGDRHAGRQHAALPGARGCRAEGRDLWAADYLAIVEELIKYWSVESLDGLNDLGRMAQEKIMGIPARLERIAEIMEKKTKPKSFAFDVVFNRVFAME